MTTDFGNTWVSAGLDSIVVSKLYSYGDTTYALTSDRGAYSIISNFTGAVKTFSSGSPVSILHVAANPSVGSAEFYYELAAESYVSLSIYDAIGREISSLLANQLQNGQQTISWNTQNMPSGEYYYRFIMKSRDIQQTIETGKIIVAR